MVAIGNPIRGPLHPFGWVRPAGNTDMAVTQTAAQHVARGGPPALDIGDGDPDRDEILAPHDGKVPRADTVGSANLWIEWTASDSKRWAVVLAHDTLPHLVAVGQGVSEGQVVDRMGNTNLPTLPVPIHLHMQLGWWNGTAWVWVDPWPYLRQNGATEDGDMIPIWGANFKRIVNKKSTLKFNGNFRDERKSGNVLELYPAGTLVYPIAYANDGDVPAGSQSGEWWACFMYVKDRGVMFGWFHSSLVNTLVDDVTVSAGVPQAKYDADVAALNARLTGIKKKVAAGAVDIADD